GMPGPGDGQGGGRKRRRERKRGKKKRALWPTVVPRDDTLYRPPKRVLTPQQREELRRRFKLENLARYVKDEKTVDDFKVIYQKMDFLEYEVEKKVANLECPVCKKPIDDFYYTLHHENGEAMAHIPCIEEELKRKHEVGPGEVLLYVGNGAFGIFKLKPNGELAKFVPPVVEPKPEVEGEKARRPRPEYSTDPRERSGLELRKKIQYETRKLTNRQQRQQIKN
ncbi:MAG: hypothetical protein J0L75_16440, partial [Spirochaetes bacterium]|nr:hypothetical protein [Spirochaetota bacterium]